MTEKLLPDLADAVWRRGGEGEEGRIEVAFVEDKIVVRDAADPRGPKLVFTEPEWDAFLAGAKDGEFDL